MLREVIGGQLRLQLPASVCSGREEVRVLWRLPLPVAACLDRLDRSRVLYRVRRRDH